MRAVLQRVRSARVEVAGEVVGEIGTGLLVLLGVAQKDQPAEARALAKKTAELRIFEDDQGKMNRSLQEIEGAVLAVSQFTLLADCRKGRRPGFSAAAPPELANHLYQEYVTALRACGLTVATGIFQAEMQVHLVNDGPVTLVLDTEKD